MQERSFLGDQKVAWIESKQKLTKPTFLCTSKNNTAFICRNRNCKQALHCSDEDCQACLSKHESCGKSHNISYLTKKLNNLTDARKEIIEAVQEIDKQFQKQFSKHFDEFVSEYPSFSLGSGLSAMIEKIYRSEKGANLNGIQADQLCTEVDERVKDLMGKVTEQLKQYDQKMGELSKQAKLIKNNLRENLTSKKEDFKGFNSVILNHPNDDEKIKFLLKSLAEIKPIESLQLLFRGSRDGFKAQTFHEKCDNINDTVVIVRTNGETNNTIAGYSHYQWNKPNNGYYVNDAGKKAFLLQLQQKEKYVPQKQSSLIVCDNRYGPGFGQDADLCISDDCNSNTNSGSMFPVTYNLEGPNKIVAGQQSLTNFIGIKNGYHFTVIDYQVFRVLFR